MKAGNPKLACVGLKRTLLRLVWGMGLLVLGFRLAAQTDDPYLEHFSIAKDEGRVLLRWVTRPGTTCEGIDIMRSTDGAAYTLIHHIPGICGGPSTSISYDFIDDMPVANRTNYYRLELGRLGTTSVRSIEVVALGKEGYSLRPSPLVEAGKLYFDNPQQESCRLQLYNVDGALIQELESNATYFSLDGSTYLPGIYLLKIHSPDGVLKAHGRILVAR